MAWCSPPVIHTFELSNSERNLVNDAQLAELSDRIARLCDNIAAGAQDCASPEHLNRIVGALECIFMAGHDDIDYDEDEAERRPDA